METLLLFSQIILTVVIALLPILYPKYSIFRKCAERGLEGLKDGKVEETVRRRGNLKTDHIWSLEVGEPGFRALARTIHRQSHINQDPVKIRLVHKNANSTNTLTGEIAGKGVVKENQAVLEVVLPGGREERVVDSPDYEVSRVLELTILKQWVTDYANRRSHWWTTLSALLWGVVSTAQIFGPG